MKYLIIGAGPSGLKFANEIGQDFLVIEEHNQIGRPVHCTGIVSKEFIYNYSNNFILNRIRGAEISLGKKKFEIGKNETVAYVIDREEFEKEMYENINENVVLGKRVKKVSYSNGKYIAEIQGEKYEGEILIGADGPRSIVRKLVTNQNIEFINGVQVLLKKMDIPGDLVRIYLDREYSDGFFAWAVPRDDDVLVGLGTYDRSPIARLKKLLKDEFKDHEIKDWVAGQIPVGELKMHHKYNIYLVGDAGLFVKATSGGGLFYGLKSSEILAESLKNEEDYEKNLKGIIKELHRDLLIHKFFSEINKKEMERIFDIISNDEIIEIINKYGDIDRPSIVGKKLLFNAEIFKLYPIFFRIFLREVF